MDGNYDLFSSKLSLVFFFNFIFLLTKQQLRKKFFKRRKFKIKINHSQQWLIFLNQLKEKV